MCNIPVTPFVALPGRNCRPDAGGLFVIHYIVICFYAHCYECRQGQHITGTTCAIGHACVLIDRAWLDLQVLAPHQETSVLTQLAQLPDDSDIDGAVSDQTGTAAGNTELYLCTLARRFKGCWPA